MKEFWIEWKGEIIITLGVCLVLMFATWFDGQPIQIQIQAGVEVRSNED